MRRPLPSVSGAVYWLGHSHLHRVRRREAHHLLPRGKDPTPPCSPLPSWLTADVSWDDWAVTGPDLAAGQAGAGERGMRESLPQNEGSLAMLQVGARQLSASTEGWKGLES